MPHFRPERDIVSRQIQNRLDELDSALYRNRRPIEGWVTHITGLGQDVSAPPTGGWRKFEIGSFWGGADVTQWFRANITIPKEFAGKQVALILQIDGWIGQGVAGEGLCYIDGKPTQGLDHNRSEIILTESAEGGESHEILIEAYCRAHEARPAFIFTAADIAVRDEQVWDFYWDLKVAYDTIAILPDESQGQVQLLDLVDHAIKMVDLNLKDDVERFSTQIEKAQAWFRKGLKKFQKPADFGRLTMFGHSHIDTAWLWPLRETRRKCSRTFSTVLKYMEKYPEYKFSQSQAQLYDYVKEHYPTIYEGIKQRVAEGRWEVVGGGWVEQDSNVAGAESLVRQYLYGNRFFRSEFGIHTRVVWIPDSFGFPFQMPQIWKKAQIEAFGTTKLGWNQYNKFPYHLFNWQGLDGSEIMTVMHPGTYCGNINPTDVKRQWDQFNQKDICDEVYFAFGYGDGGGGPTPGMLENGKRLGEMIGLPRTEIGTLTQAMDRTRESADADRIPTYHDEMYFELHRGCQTSQALIKRNNRKSELALRDAEFFSSLASLSGAQYPSDELYECWKVHLTNQFHDILPGTSVTEVYTESATQHAEIQATAARLSDTALSSLNGKGKSIVVWNTAGWDRRDTAILSARSVGKNEGVINADGKLVASQVVETPDGKALLFEANVPALGSTEFMVAKNAVVSSGKAPKATLTHGGATLDNAFFNVRIDTKGHITRIRDKRYNREVLPKGAVANELQMFDDRPADWTAWDIDFNFEETMWTVDNVASMDVTESGPVRATVRIVKKTDASTITQDISVFRSNPRIDFVTEIDWHEKLRLLKAAFPVDVMARNATYEVQYGAIERPTHHSTIIDRAKFEVPAHRWIDLSEGDYGVSLLNDCKYGFDTYGNTMRISLLRSPTDPDPVADQGVHKMVYSLMPHAGDWRDAETVRRGYELNAPLVATHGTGGSESFVTVDRYGVVIDCVKKAEDSDALIVRLYEAHGTRGPVTLAFANAPASITECDLMEENDVNCTVSSGAVSFEIKPWEIRSFKVAF
jgi:alpha-mannosidase